MRKPSECKSINYRAKQRQDYSINCQLINATKTTHPQNLWEDRNYDNHEPIITTVNLRRFCTNIIRDTVASWKVFNRGTQNQIFPKQIFYIQCQYVTMKRGVTVFCTTKGYGHECFRNVSMACLRYSRILTT